MNSLLRAAGLVVVVTMAVAVLIPLLCRLVAVVFVPVVVLVLLVMAGRVIWWYTERGI